MEEIKATDTEELFLCLPCAKDYEGGVYKTLKSIKIGGHVKQKGTCDHCCRRRYGYRCKVEYHDVITGRDINGNPYADILEGGFGL